jgi:formate-dependent nitrite reductase cytochrome c552 subunit
MLTAVLACVVGQGVPAIAQASYDDHAVSGSLTRALSVDCAHCHDDSKRATHAVAQRMMTMVAEINRRLESGRGGRVTCWTCHAGERVPSRIPRVAWEKTLAAWPAGAPDAAENVKLTMAVYSASVGRTCAGCHDAERQWRATDEATEVVALMNSFFPVMEKYLPAGARTQCFMCHKGRPHPHRD